MWQSKREISLLQGKHLPFTPSPLRLDIFRLFVILSLNQLYRSTPEIFLFSTATFKYKYRAPLPDFETREVHKGFSMGFFSRAVDITMRPTNVTSNG
jgi:hypothetical protein